MLLPDKLEQEFIALTPFLQSKNDDNMAEDMTRGRRLLMDMNSIALFGKPLNAYIEETVSELTDDRVRNRLEQAVADALPQAVADAVADATLQKEKEKEAERRHAIHALVKVNFSMEQIAEVLGLDLAYVQKCYQSLSRKILHKLLKYPLFKPKSVVF